MLTSIFATSKGKNNVETAVLLLSSTGKAVSDVSFFKVSNVIKTFTRRCFMFLIIKKPMLKLSIPDLNS